MGFSRPYSNGQLSVFAMERAVGACCVRDRRRYVAVELAAYELSVRSPTQFSLRHEILEHDFTCAAAQTEQARGLVQVQAKPWHLAERPQNHRDELGPARLC